MTWAPAFNRLWSVFGGDPARCGDLEVRAAGHHLRSRYEVDGLAVGAVLLAAVELATARGLSRPHASLGARHVAIAFASERHVERNRSSPGSTFAPLSRFLPTRDGWIRLHATYPHHRDALLRALGTDAAGVPDTLAGADVEAAEAAIHAADGVAAAVRAERAWRARP